jgi:peptide/nickel transport system substrate-binding protein
MFGRSGRVLAGLLLALSVMIGCAPVPATDVPTSEAGAVPSLKPPAAEPTESVTRGQGGTLRLLYWQAPTMLNPHLSVGTKDLSASRITYEPLASFDAEGNLIPFLAAEIPSVENGAVASDGMSVTWTVKPDIKWADGEPFTADDVLFTYEFISNPEVKSTSATAYKTVESVEVIDELTVKVNFNAPNPAWFAAFVGSQGMILPRHVFEEYNGANAADAPANLIAVGTGPFYVTEYNAEDILLIGNDAVSTVKIVYEANPYFREPDKPYFGAVELQGGGDIQLGALAVKSGIVDFAWNLAVAEDIAVDVDAGGIATIKPTPSAFVERVMINFTDPNIPTDAGERSSLQFPHPALSDIAVRRAIALAIDREAIAEAYGRSGVFTPNIIVEPPVYDSADSPYAYDPLKAVQLLEEAGWVDTDGDGVRERDGVRLSLVHQTSIQGLRQFAQEVIKQNLEEIGFDIELKQIDSSIFLGLPDNTTDTRRQFYADLEQFSFSNKSPDPAPYMSGWTCDQASQMENNWSGTNWSRYCNPEFDKLYAEALTELDPQRRIELFDRMNQILIDDAAVIPLIHVYNPVGLINTLRGYEFTPWDVEVWDIMNWYREE